MLEYNPLCTLTILYFYRFFYLSETKLGFDYFFQNGNFSYRPTRAVLKKKMVNVTLTIELTLNSLRGKLQSLELSKLVNTK